jgi:ABC-type cobalamin/Fe3+-siderophores transport system ATPase subunit
MELNKVTTVIIGAAGSGKTTEAKKIASEYDEGNVVWINGSNLSFNRCNEDTELVIIEDFKYVNAFFVLSTNAIDGIRVENQGKEAFYIYPRIVVVCNSDITIKDLQIHSKAFSRRFNIVDLSPEKIKKYSYTIDDIERAVNHWSMTTVEKENIIKFLEK